MSLHRYLCCRSVLRIREFSWRRPCFQLRRAEHQMAFAEWFESIQQRQVPDQQYHWRKVAASHQERCGDWRGRVQMRVERKSSEIPAQHLLWVSQSFWVCFNFSAFQINWRLTNTQNRRSLKKTATLHWDAKLEEFPLRESSGTSRIMNLVRLQTFWQCFGFDWDFNLINFSSCKPKRRDCWWWDNFEKCESRSSWKLWLRCNSKPWWLQAQPRKQHRLDRWT